MNLVWSDAANFNHFKLQECCCGDAAVGSAHALQISAGTHAPFNAGPHNKFVLTTTNGGATPTEVDFRFDTTTALANPQTITLQTVEDQGDGFGVPYALWNAEVSTTCTVDVDGGDADSVTAYVNASTGTTYDTLTVVCPDPPTDAWYAGATLTVLCTTNLAPNPMTPALFAAIVSTTEDLAKTISYQCPATVDDEDDVYGGAGPWYDPMTGACAAVTAANWYVNTTAATALTDGTMDPNTLVAGRIPTSSVLSLGVVTPLATDQTIVCTFSQVVWDVGVSNPVVSGGSSTATGLASNGGKTITITATRAFPADDYTFTFSTNLAANFATGAVTVSCSSTQDVTPLTGTSFTTEAATKVDWTVGGADSGYAKPTGTGRFNTGVAPATYAFKFDITGALLAGDTITLEAVRGGALAIWGSIAAVSCTVAIDGGSAASVTASATSTSTLVVTVPSGGYAGSATVDIICSSNIAANAAASGTAVSIEATTTADTAAADSKADTSSNVNYYWTITAVPTVDWTVGGADSGYAKPDAGANSKKESFTPASLSFSFKVSTFGSLASGDTIVLKAVRDGAAIKVWAAAGAVTCGTLTQGGSAFTASSILASASTASTFDTLTITLSSGIADVATVVIVCTGNIAANAAANSNYVSFGATTTCDGTSSNSYNGGATGYSYVITATPAPTPAPTTPAPTPAPTTAPPEPTPDAIEDVLESVNQTDLDVVAADYGLPGNITLGAVTTTSTTVVFTCEACDLNTVTFNDTRKVQYRDVIANISGVNISQVTIGDVRNVTARRRRLLSATCSGESISVDTVITSLASVAAAIETILDGDEFPTTIVLIIVGAFALMCFIMPPPTRRRGHFYGPIRLRT